MFYNQMKILGISDIIWFQTFFFPFDIIIVFEVTHLWRPQKMTNKRPSHFHHPSKWTRDLLFKRMESANACQILRRPLPTPLLCRHKCMFPFCFLKIGLWNFWMQMKFWILWKFSSQFLFSQAFKETKLIFPTKSVNFLNSFLVSLCQ